MSPGAFRTCIQSFIPVIYTFFLINFILNTLFYYFEYTLFYPYTKSEDFLCG